MAEGSGENKEWRMHSAFRRKVIEAGVEYSVKHLLQQAGIVEIVKTWYDIVELKNHTKVFSGSDTPHQNVKHLEMHNQLKEVCLTSQSEG